jgi:hypothetical protein
MEHIRWTPGIGDPTFLGWFTVFAYFLSAWLCLQAFMAEKSGPRRPIVDSIKALVRVVRKHWPSPPAPARRAATWCIYSLVLALLGLNKQLDLQSLFTEIGRVVAHDQGWYESRRTVQAAFILILLAFGLAGIFAALFLLRGSGKELRLGSLGLIFLTCFVLVRASSFHHVDVFFGSTVHGLPINNLLELGGIGLIGAGATLRLRERKHSRK